MFYAQLNEENICFAVSQLSGEVQADNLIEISFFDTSIVGKKYVDGTWVEVEQPIVDPEPTQLDRIEEQTQSLDKLQATVDYLAMMAE